MFEKLFVEKYRPKTLDSLILEPQTKQIFERYVWDQEIPNLLFVGRPGTGKSTLAQIIVNDILKCQYLYINASDENGIDTIRQKVLGFAQTKSIDGKIKVVILDEVDFLSINSEAALRNVMESTAKFCRFILTANYEHKIIPALQSRCQKFVLKPTLEDVIKRCVYILKQESIRIDSTQKDKLLNLIKQYFPDIRKIINELQKFSYSGTLQIVDNSSTDEFIKKLFDVITNKRVVNSRHLWIGNEQLFSNDYQQLMRDILNHIYDITISGDRKKDMILILADHMYKASFCLDQEINYFSCMLQLEKLWG